MIQMSLKLLVEMIWNLLSMSKGMNDYVINDLMSDGFFIDSPSSLEFAWSWRSRFDSENQGLGS
jgi:hypothetical protein